MANAAWQRICIPGPKFVAFAVVHDQAPLQHDDDLVLAVMRVPVAARAGIELAFEDGRDRVSQKDAQAGGPKVKGLVHLRIDPRPPAKSERLGQRLAVEGERSGAFPDPLESGYADERT